MSSNPPAENTKTRLAAGRAADRVLRTRQGGGAGPRSVFCEGAATPEAKAGHRNPPSENTKTRLAAGFCV